MPPRQTIFTSETGRDAAGLRSDPDASIAALRDASSEKQAAGPPIAWARSVLSVLRRSWHVFRKRRHADGLHNLNERELTDIGLTRGDIDHLVARRTVERLKDGTAYLWR